MKAVFERTRLDDQRNEDVHYGFEMAHKMKGINCGVDAENHTELVVAMKRRLSEDPTDRECRY